MSPDPETLAMIARLSGGRAFAADDGPRLTGIYRRLADGMRNRTHERAEVSAFALAGAAPLLLAGGLSSLSLRPRLP
jgi:hypothetical protein